MPAEPLAATHAAPDAAERLPSLRRRVLWRVMLPLALTWLLGSAVAVAVAYIYTRKAFDRSMLDDAYAVAASVGLHDGRLALNLSPREVAEVLFDHNEKVFFAVLRADGSLLAGQDGLRAEPVDRSEPWVVQDRRYEGLDLRMVTLNREEPQPYSVVVAQTTLTRSQMAGQLLAAALAPQAALLLALGLWLRRSVRAELEPLGRLEQALAQRDTRDLARVHLRPRSRDIAHLADAFNALMARIDAGVRAQREFAGNVAHELRTPLAGIRSLAEYGLAQTDPRAWQNQLRNILASEQRASHLVDQLLALALADEAGESLQTETVAVDALLRDLLLRQIPRADALGVDLGAAGLDLPLEVIATPALLEGLMSNLIDNALRYGRPESPAVAARVTVAAEVQGSSLCLSVTDNGPGMDADQCARVLGRWEQGRAGIRRGAGAGLGLAIAARYVALLGGRLALGAAPEGPGLRASVWLPCVPAAARADRGG